MTDAPMLSLAGGRLTLDPATRRYTLAEHETDGARPAVSRRAMVRGCSGTGPSPGMVLTREQLLDAVARRPDDVFERV